MQEFKDFTSTYLRLIFCWKKGTLHIYWKQDDLDKFNEFYLDQLNKDTDFMKQLEELHFDHSANLLDYTKPFPTMDFAKKTNAQLLEMLKQYNALYTNLTLYSCIGIIGSFTLEEILVPYLKNKLKKARSEEKFGEYFSILTNHSGKSWHRMQEEDLLEIADKVRAGASAKGSQVQQMLDAHVQKYCWLELGYNFLGQPLKKEHFVEKLGKVVEHGLPVLPSQQHVSKRKNKIAKELNIDAKHLNLFNSLGKLIYLKEYRDGVYCKAQYELNFIIKEVLQRFKVPERIGWHMTMQEYQDLLTGVGLEFEKIKHRQELFVWAYDNDEKLLVGKQAEEFIQKELGQLGVNPAKVRELEGNVASPGYARGTAKIVHDETELGKVKQGDVLVAYMTKPSYIPAMDLASAIVTNEGGVTCHAAIVSREMNKPCVIGTKIATHVINDGDEIEVDARKGKVKILTKAKLEIKTRLKR